MGIALGHPVPVVAFYTGQPLPSSPNHYLKKTKQNAQSHVNSLGKYLKRISDKSRSAFLGDELHLQTAINKSFLLSSSFYKSYLVGWPGPELVYVSVIDKWELQALSPWKVHEEQRGGSRSRSSSPPCPVWTELEVPTPLKRGHVATWPLCASQQVSINISGISSPKT